MVHLAGEPGGRLHQPLPCRIFGPNSGGTRIQGEKWLRYYYDRILNGAESGSVSAEDPRIIQTELPGSLIASASGSHGKGSLGIGIVVQSS